MVMTKPSTQFAANFTIFFERKVDHFLKVSMVYYTIWIDPVIILLIMYQFNYATVDAHISRHTVTDTHKYWFNVLYINVDSAIKVNGYIYLENTQWVYV